MPESEAAPKPGSPATGLAVLGIVYGDIGTSPIYALRECFRGVSPVPITEANILGILSLIFWALIIVISLKYMIFILRANNYGEGGIFAFLALLRPDQDQDSRTRRTLILTGLFGAGLLYGEHHAGDHHSGLQCGPGARRLEPGQGERFSAGIPDG